MKFTKEQIMKIILEELEAIEEQSSSDIPVIDYEEAQDDSEAGILPQLRKANNGEPVLFKAKGKNKEYSSVYTKYKPSAAKAKEYQENGIELIWYDGRYEISSLSPEGLLSVYGVAAKERDFASKIGASYHYGFNEQLDNIIDEELEKMSKAQAKEK